MKSALECIMILDSRRQFLKRLPAAALCVAAPSLALYSLHGSAATAGFQIHDIDWFDDVRERAVPIRLYQPSEATTTTPVPLIIFSHGIGGSRLGSSYLGRYWASHGLASLHVQHVGSDRSIWFGNPFNLVSRLQEICVNIGQGACLSYSYTTVGIGSRRGDWPILNCCASRSKISRHVIFFRIG